LEFQALARPLVGRRCISREQRFAGMCGGGPVQTARKALGWPPGGGARPPFAGRGWPKEDRGFVVGRGFGWVILRARGKESAREIHGNKALRAELPRAQRPRRPRPGRRVGLPPVVRKNLPGIEVRRISSKDLGNFLKRAHAGVFGEGRGPQSKLAGGNWLAFEPLKNYQLMWGTGRMEGGRRGGLAAGNTRGRAFPSGLY